MKSPLQGICFAGEIELYGISDIARERVKRKC